MSEKPTSSPVPTGVPFIYSNGFNAFVSNADVGITLLAHGQPAATVLMSYNSAKSLLEAMQKTVETLEKATGQPIATTDEMQKILVKYQNANPSAQK